MENNDKILSLQEMQDMFCDYVFKKLSDDDRQAFDNSLFKYPDLIKELDEVNLAFNRVQQKKLDKKISSYTRNLSVKVNQKLSNQRRITYKLQRLNKYLIPASGLATILLIVTYFNLFVNDNTVVQKNNKLQNQSFTGITQTDLDSLFNDKMDKVDYLNEVERLIPLNIQSQSDLLANLENIEIGSDLNEIYNDILSEQILLDGNSISKFEAIKQYDLFKNIENLEEEDIENILKELENADFNT